MILFAPAVGGIGYFALSISCDAVKDSSSLMKPVLTISGWIAGGSLGAYFGGYLFEIVGDYRFAFFIGACASVLAGACVWHFVLPGKQTETTST